MPSVRLSRGLTDSGRGTETALNQSYLNRTYKELRKSSTRK
jgi:hypothetical protein